jgi:hypothetical protein
MFTDNRNGTGTLSGTPALGTVGTYAVTFKAHNGVSPDATQNFTLMVVKADTQTSAVTSSANPSILNQPITFTAHVFAKAPATGTPTGSVDFYDGTTKIGSATLNNSGTAAFTTSALAVGSHSISAVYAGDANYTGSNSAAPPVIQRVGYAVKLLYDPTKASKSGSNIPIKISLQDYQGNNMSSAAITVTVTGVAPNRGVAQPSGTFTFMPTLGSGGGYEYDLKTTGYPTGSYSLTFTAGADPITHQAPFILR